MGITKFGSNFHPCPPYERRILHPFVCTCWQWLLTRSARNNGSTLNHSSLLQNCHLLSTTSRTLLHRIWWSGGDEFTSASLRTLSPNDPSSAEAACQCRFLTDVNILLWTELLTVCPGNLATSDTQRRFREKLTHNTTLVTWLHDIRRVEWLHIEQLTLHILWKTVQYADCFSVYHAYITELCPRTRIVIVLELLVHL